MDESKVNFLDKLSDIIIKIDKSVGFKNILKYVILFLVLFGLFNFRTIVKESVGFIQEIYEELHTEKMERRDLLLQELSPILQEYRAAVGADRILYFEYHNSKENLVGIPFKYLDLVLQNSRYGVNLVPESKFQDINVGVLGTVLNGIKGGEVVYRYKLDDEDFHRDHPGAYELTCDNVSQAFISIPGVTQPIGMIVLEWVSRDIDLEEVELVEYYSYNRGGYISRINGLIMSMSYR